MLVTNAHVVWPYDAVRVVFPDGTEIIDAPVIGVDDLADLAIIDLAGTAGLPAPVVLTDPSGIPVGDELFLIGYPGEVEDFPQPTLTRGILSRWRTLDSLDLDFLQTDAVIAGGQSGGALVNDAGEVIGISGLGSDGFALVTSAADVQERIGGLIQGVDVDGIVDRPFPTGEGAQSFTVEIDNFYAEAVWIVDLEVGDEIRVEATSEGDASIVLIASDGFTEAVADEHASGTETLTAVAPFPGPYFVAVGSFAFEPITVDVSSNLPMREFTDPDDGSVLTAGDTYYGYAEFPGDRDYFLIDLAAGETVTVFASALLMDPDIVIDRADNPDDALAFDATSGGGLFGTDALVEFTADEDATYLIALIDAFFGPGGYVMTLD
jgi:hypothetical protein